MDNDMKIIIYNLIEHILKNELEEFDKLTILARKYLTTFELRIFTNWREGKYD